MSELAGQVFIVTGAGGAIAAAIVDALAQGGAQLVLVDRDERHISARAAQYGGLSITADLSTVAGAERMVERALERFGRLDGLIHTVGGYAWGKIEDADPGTYERMFDLNVRSLFYAVRAVLPTMRAQNSGFIAGISSAPGWTGSAKGSALYAAAKAAVATFLRSLDEDLEGSAVRVAVLYPMGAVDTPANRKSMPDADPAGLIDPNELGAAIRFAAGRSVRGRVTALPVYPPR